MTTLVKYLTIFGIWTIVKGHQNTKSKEKRILLDNQSYLQQQLDHLQSEFQNLLVKVESQQHTIASQQTTINNLQIKVSNDSSTIAVLQSELASQQSGISSEQNRIASQQTTINKLESKLSNESSTVAILQSKLASRQSGTGVSFIRWGRKDCPGNFSIVYTGYAGGSWNGHSGAAADYLCMPHEPIWGPNKNKLPRSIMVGYVYGAEYESPSVYGMVDSQDVPCAFCHSSHYSTQAMIPGRTACYPGWTEAYHGDLSCGLHTSIAASQYVCVDQHPEPLDGGANVNNNEKFFYPVKAKCGALRCPPYEEGKMLSCVVCLK